MKAGQLCEWYNSGRAAEDLYPLSSYAHLHRCCEYPSKTSSPNTRKPLKVRGERRDNPRTYPREAQGSGTNTEKARSSLWLRRKKCRTNCAALGTRNSRSTRKQATRPCIGTASAPRRPNPLTHENPFLPCPSIRGTREKGLSFTVLPTTVYHT